MNKNRNIRKTYEITFNQVEKEYLSSLYGKAAGFVKIMCGHNRSGMFLQTSAACGGLQEKYFNSLVLDEQNMMMSMSTFRKKGSAKEEDILDVCCLAVDIDYNFTDKKGNLFHPLTAWQQLCLSIIEKDIEFPLPTYLEYSHRLRLVYVFDNPVFLPDDKKKRRQTVSWLKRIMTVLCEKINGIDKRYHAEIQQLTKFVRVPKALNVKFLPFYDCDNKRYKYHTANKDYVCISKLSNGRLWDIHDLSDAVLPELPAWYGEYNSRPKKRKPAISINGNTENFLIKRMNLLKALPGLGWDEGYREIICFLYWNFGKQAGYSEETMCEETLKLNQTFKHPLPEKDVLSHSRPRKSYFYRLRTFAEILDLPAELVKEFGLGYLNPKEYNREYSRHYRIQEKIKKQKLGITRKQLQQKLTEDVLRLRSFGLKIREIAEQLSVSVSTVCRHMAVSPT